MIKAMIVEDEWYTLEDIKAMVEATGFIEVCGAYENPLKALEESKEILPQVAFVDIEMPQMNGLTLAEKLLESNPSLHVVFITAYNQYAVQAFDINALDYIMKPIDIERFSKMAEKLKKVAFVTENKKHPLDIQCFGDFEVKIDDIPVKWGRAKAEELFAYLLFNHKRKIHKDVIIEDLWAEYEPPRALVILQTTVYKLRNIFALLKDNVTIEYIGSKYCLSITECSCDLFWVENLLAIYSPENKSTYQYIEQACSLVEKGLLTQHGYLWSYAREAQLNNHFCEILHHVIVYHSKRGEVELEDKFRKLLNRLELTEE